MKRNFVVSLFGSFVGVGLLLIFLSVTGSVGARGADARSDTVRTNEVSAATPLTSTFTYNGQIKNSGVAVNGSCAMAFRLYDDPSAGNLIGTSPITLTVPVTNGLFTVGLNFGTSAFDGTNRWLDIQVNCMGTFVPLPRQAVTAAPYALFAGNASLLNGQNSSAFVNLSSNQTISGVKTFSGGIKFADGTTLPSGLYQPKLPGAGTAASVGSPGWGDGQYSSITIGADGLGLISYQESGYALRVLHCGNAACNSGNISTELDYVGSLGFFSSITIGADGLGLISYQDGTNYDMRVLHCGNVLCNRDNTITSVNSTGNVGFDTSITIGADGLGLISYYDATNTALKIVHCGNLVCNSGGNNTIIDNSADVGHFTSVTIGADGLGLISYYDKTNGTLKVLRCGNATCTSGNISTTVDSVGTADIGSNSTSITIGADGLGLISYLQNSTGDLKVLHCGNAACNSGNMVTTVDGSAGIAYRYTSITIGTDGLGLVSYYDGNLRVLHCGNTTCSSGNISSTVDSNLSVGHYNSITLGADGLGLISYYDDTNFDLKVFHCSKLTCTPYTRVGR